MRRVILFLIFIIFIPCLYASKVSDFFTGDSQEKRNLKASGLLETLINDGTLIQSDENESFSKIIGSTADLVLISIHDCLFPSLNNLTKSDSTKIFSIKKESFLGVLIYSLVALECIILAIENFMTDSINAIKISTRIVQIILLMTFISFLPAICDAILNIFSSMGVILSGNENFSQKTDKHPFTYMPSDVLYTLNICKKMLSIEHIRIGGYELSTIIPHFIVSIGEFLVSIPFIILMLIIVFWYCEMFLIFIAGCLALPFNVFSKSSITDYKSILKAMLMQGIKISVGVFLATFTKDIIISSLKMINSSFTSTTHAVIFTIFITLVIFFIITQGNKIIISALSGSNNSSNTNPLSFTSGLLTASALSLKKSIGNISEPKTDKLKNQKDLTTAKIDKKIDNTPNNIKISDKNYKDNNETQTINSKAQKLKSDDKYGEVSALATKDRINAARVELLNEGNTNPSEEEVISKAKKDAIIVKLVKMEKKGFILSDGRYNRPAAEQLRKLRDNAI